MNVLDENIPDSQCQLLRSWGIHDSEFNTRTKRMGKVIRITHTGIQIWQLNTEKEEVLRVSV